MMTSTTNPTGERSGEVRSLTGLRGVAALYVIGFHCHTIFPSRPLPAMFDCGFLGVDVFFILSGFILCSLYADLTPNRWGRFWLKRAFRIYPLHLAVMAGLGLVIGTALLLHVTVGPFYTAKSFLEVAALIHVYVGDYGWNDPTWSIAVEMACYVLLPFALPLLMRLKQNFLKPLFVGLFLADILLVTSVATVAHGTVYIAIVGWVPLARGFLGFGAGCVLARIIALDVFRHGMVCELFAWSPIYHLGELSFSLYLLHQPVIEFLKKIDPILARHHLAWTETPVTLIVVLGLSVLTHAWIEVPGRRVPDRILSMWRPARSPDALAA